MRSFSPIHTHRIVTPHIPIKAAKVLAIGNLDGVHLGHQALTQTARTLAEKHGQTPAVLTFEPHPRVFFKPELKPLNLLRVSTKIEALMSEGFHEVFIAQFNRRLSDMPARAFIEDFCVGQLGAQHVVTGANFRFGKDRLGDAELMSGTMQSLGLDYSCVTPVTSADGEVISSTRIRSLLKQGEVKAAAQLLGRPYHISGRVQHGDKRGRTLGFPTANMALHQLFLPAYGVYAVHVHIGRQEFSGVANLGVRPSIGSTQPLLEVHLFDFNAELYGQRMNVHLIQRLRPEQTFTSTQSMIDQLGQDVIEARQICNSLH